MHTFMILCQYLPQARRGGVCDFREKKKKKNQKGSDKYKADFCHSF